MDQCHIPRCSTRDSTPTRTALGVASRLRSCAKPPRRCSPCLRRHHPPCPELHEWTVRAALLTVDKFVDRHTARARRCVQSTDSSKEVCHHPVPHKQGDTAPGITGLPRVHWN